MVRPAVCRAGPAERLATAAPLLLYISQSRPDLKSHLSALIRQPSPAQPGESVRVSFCFATVAFSLREPRGATTSMHCAAMSGKLPRRRSGSPSSGRRRGGRRDSRAGSAARSGWLDRFVTALFPGSIAATASSMVQLPGPFVATAAAYPPRFGLCTVFLSTA